MNKRLKVVLLTDVLENIAGGAERQIYELCKGIDKNKFDPYLLILHQKTIPLEIAELGINTEAIGIKRIYSLTAILKGFKFARFLKAKNIDILMTYHFGSDVWGSIFGTIARCPFIVSNRRDIGFWKMNYHIWMYRLIDRLCVNTIVTNSSISREFIINQERTKKNKIKVIYNGVDLDKFSREVETKTIKENLGFEPRHLVVGCVGNFRAIKGHKYLIEAAAEVLKDFLCVKFMFVGNGPLQNDLKSLAEALGIKNSAVFLGSRRDIVELISIMDICVQPSLSESLSNSILEYMAAGKPVVATNAGGNPELIEDQINGILVARSNSNALKNAIIELIKDKEKARIFGRTARKIAEEKFSLPGMISNYENFFKEKKGGTIKILHLVSSNGLFGAEKVLLDLAVAANKNGFFAVVGAIRNSHNPHLEIIEEAKKSGLETIVFDSNGSFDFSAPFKIKSFLEKNSIDIIHTHNYKSDILGFIAAKTTNKKWIATNHVWHGLNFKLKCYEFIDAFLLKFADKVVAVSDDIENDLIKRRIARLKVKKIYNGIDPSLFTGCVYPKELRKELGVLPREIVVAAVGRLSPEKGHKIFLEAAGIIAERNKGIKFLIVGDGPLRFQLEQKARNSNLGKRVIFTGIRNDIPKIYSITDIIVNASFIEGLPLIILEAMASGVAVIATKVGAVPKVIRNNENGILIEPGNTLRLAAAITELIENEEKRKNLALKAYEDVRVKFSAERMGSEYIETYRELLN